MNKISRLGSLLGLSLMCTAPVVADPSVFFTDFSYKGLDLGKTEQIVSNSQYLNPILKGYYPDPSICRAGDDYYLINSTFTHFPGIPVWHSTDLVNWKQIGFAIDRPEQADFNGLSTSQGMFAPAIDYHNGTFYIICTNAYGYGNYYVTAKDPAGSWSDPVMLPFVNGIDPAFFFDDDGSVYIVHNGEPPRNKPLYNGHRAIWMWKYDLVNHKPVGEAKLLVNGGVDISTEPVWIEGPHIFKKDGYYYLICAEGGTGDNHSEVVFRTESLTEPFVPYSKNPILTQRDQNPERSNPIACVGHADFVETPEGDWWSVFLGTRPYEGHFSHMGRETFLLPVQWSADGWPSILPQGDLLPYKNSAPYPKKGTRLVSSDFSDSFESSTLSTHWTFLRTPLEKWYSLEVSPGTLAVFPLAESLESNKNTSFIGYRQKDNHFRSSVSLELPQSEGTSAGIALYQNETSNLFCGIRKLSGDNYQLFIEKAAQGAVETIYAYELAGVDSETITLAVDGNEAMHTFSYSLDENSYKTLGEAIDAHFLSTAKAGGFVGVVMGPYARKDQ